MDPAAKLPSEIPVGGAPADSGATADDAFETLKTRARRGVVILVVRTAFVQLTVFAGQIALARLLDPRDFGVYAIVQFALSFFSFFGDAGLGGGLIQKKVHPSQRELSSVFFAQVLIALGIIVVVFGAAEFSRLVWPDLPATGPWLLRALSFSLLLTALRTIPCILMDVSCPSASSARSTLFSV